MTKKTNGKITFSTEFDSLNLNEMKETQKKCFL